MVKKKADAPQSTSYDVIIVGGGMVGMTLAAALAYKKLRVALVEKQAIEAQTRPAFDGRVSAVSHGSVLIFQSIGLWPDMLPGAQPIYDIRVVDGYSTAHVHYNYRDVGDKPFGFIVENRVLREALVKAVTTSPHITLHTGVSIDSMERDAYHAHVLLTDGKEVVAPLVVGAEGRNSPTRMLAGIGTTETPYNQTAIVCTIKHEIPHEGLALERFLPAGPFAVLPMLNDRSSLVWTEPASVAPLMLKLETEALVAEITKRVGSYLGAISVEGPCYSHPLGLMLADRMTDTRLALIGDAAHAIHPIAGQGVNLGFRDVSVLADLISEQHALGLDIGSVTMLKRYEQWRRFDTTSMTVVTDGLTRLFSNNVAPLRWLRDTGLRAVNHLPPVKRLFMRHAMGVTGTLPELMRKAG